MSLENYVNHKTSFLYDDEERTEEDLIEAENYREYLYSFEDEE